MTQQADKPNDIGRNFLLGNRKKIAKFLMRTFTCRSTFLFDPNEANGRKLLQAAIKVEKLHAILFAIFFFRNLPLFWFYLLYLLLRPTRGGTNHRAIYSADEGLELKQLVVAHLLFWQTLKHVASKTALDQQVFEIFIEFKVF